MRLTHDIRRAFVAAVMADVPKADYDERILRVATDIAVAALPIKVRAIWKDPETRGYVAAPDAYINDEHMCLPGYCKELQAPIEAAIRDLVSARDAQTKTRCKLKNDLTRAAFTANTDKTLRELLPEFANYIPDTAVKPLDHPVPVPLVGIADEFRAAGWAPKQTEKEN